jgi:hypothetical protein
MLRLSICVRVSMDARVKPAHDEEKNVSNLTGICSSG